MNTTWAINALRLQKDNTKLAGLLEEALDCIDQYDYEEAFDLVQRIKDALNHSRTSHPPVVPWGGSSLTEMEELLQKVQQLERDKLKMLADLQVESEINAKGGEREYVLLGKVERLERENAELKIERNRYRIALEDIAQASDEWAGDRARRELGREDKS